MHLASLFKDHSPEIKALIFEKCILLKNAEHHFLVIYNSLERFGSCSQDNLRTRLRGQVGEASFFLPILKKKLCLVLLNEFLIDNI